MTQPIETAYIPGRTLYAVLHFGGQVWNKDTVAFENYSQGNWSHYAVPLSEQTASGYYSVAYPAGIAAGTLSTEIIYQQNGVSPTLPALPGGDSFLTIGQSQGSNVATIGFSGLAALNLGKAAATEVQGAAVTGTLSTTQMTTNLTNTNNGAYVGRTIYWTSGALLGMATNVTGYLVTGGKLTFTAVPIAPANGDTFILV